MSCIKFLGQLGDDLFGGMPSNHLSSLPSIRASDSHTYRTSSTGAGQELSGIQEACTISEEEFSVAKAKLFE